MHYTISYAALDGDAKVAKALADCREYLGDDLFVSTCEAVRNAIKNGETERTIIRLLGGCLGISGYPAQVLIDHVRGSD